MKNSYLKWSGGKRNALPHLKPTLTRVQNTYNAERLVEPFVGGGTVSLNLTFNEYLLADFNLDLIACHNMMINSPLQQIEQGLSELYAAGYDKYYDLRQRFNDGGLNSFERALLFIYLNKFGFNGLCRYNSSGKFNVSKGSSSSQKHPPIEQIALFADYFSGQKFVYQSFLDTFNQLKSTDLVYCDPPYLPATKSQYNYTASGFRLEDHTSLVEAAKKSPAPVIISNHDTLLSRELYCDADELVFFTVPRTISCKTATRSGASELMAIYHKR